MKNNRNGRRFRDLLVQEVVCLLQNKTVTGRDRIGLGLGLGLGLGFRVLGC